MIQGAAGLGKTALLGELRAQALDFQVLRADGLENDRTPYTLLHQWGVHPPRSSADEEPSTRVAAQALQDHIDTMSVDRPVLLLADDLHWADPESVEAFLWLLRRASGDRLLIAVGTRPLPTQLHSGLQRWINDRDAAVAVELTGLTPEQATEVARARWPELSDDLALRLHEHTGGNPLYLTTLLAEHDLDELTNSGMLPAPAMFARSIALRTARLSDPAVDLLRAVCVLDSSWTSLALAGTVSTAAGIADTTASAQELAEAGLVDLRRTNGPLQLRPAHALIRASVYQQTPLPQLQQTHASAARHARSRSAALEHRMAAAKQYDDALAEEMASYANDLYARRSFRQAAQYLRWSSALTADPTLRERRWLEALFDLVIGYDFAAADGELDDVRASDRTVWRALVLGLHAVWQRRLRDGVEYLEPIAVTELSASGSRPRYLAEVLLCWARLCLGQPTEVIEEGLARAAAVRIDDAGLSGLEIVTRSQVSIRRHGAGAVVEQLSTLPSATAVPFSATGALAFRGTVRATLGLTHEASEDLAEATRRITDGVTDLGAGSFHAVLGLVQWLTGEWGRAGISFRQALDIGGEFAHPMTIALAPLVDIGRGHFDQADLMITRARDSLLESPWPEASHFFAITLLARVHAGGTAAEKTSALANLRGSPFDVTDMVRANAVLLLNYIPALVWAGRLEEAEAAVTQLAAIEPAAPWAYPVASWYTGLISEARGDTSGAVESLTSALAQELSLPLYRAHLLSDHARISQTLRRPGAKQSMRQAEEIYRRLGATPYLQRLAAMPDVASGPASTSTYLAALTERESNVITLLLAGMSYAQIARELFITQSTVSYHLGNIYAKVGVTSRHELSDLARNRPYALGLSSP